MRGYGRRLLASGLIVAALALVVPSARAEVIAREDNGFVIRIASEVTATPAEAWKRLLTPAQWWQSQHTFSGDSTNLTLDPVIGGCFCEALVRPETLPPLQKGERWNGGVQHMRIVYLEPPRAIRMVGALGPLQSEALAGTMTITVKPTETPAGKGSRILFEYVVGGFMRYKVEDIAPAVDRMLTAQLTSLASKLGPVAEPASPSTNSAPVGPPAPEGELPAVGPASKAVVPLSGAESYSLPPAGSKPALKPEPKPEAKLGLKVDAGAALAASAAPAKPAPKAPPAKIAAQPSASKPALKPVAKASAKPATKPAAKAPDLEVDAHRDANAAFDALLSGASAP